MLPDNFSFVVPGRLAGMARPPYGGEPLVDALIDLAREGVTAVASLTEEPLETDALARARFAYLHLPVPDFTPPTRAQIDRLVAFARAAWAERRAVAVHCLAGMGRTGTMLAALLVAEGMDGERAIATIRARRPGSIETPAQEDAVRAYPRGGPSA